jgi:hypothetical protein
MYKIIMMERERKATVLLSPNQLCYCVCLFVLFVTYFVHNVSATVTYDRKELLEMRTAITHLVLKENYFFNESDMRDLLQTTDKALIPVIRKRKRRWYQGRRSRCFVRIRRQEG